MTRLLNTFHVSPVATAVSIAILGAVVLGGTRERAESTSDQRFASIIPDRCAGGTEVSAFVCRNTWVASTKQGTR
jgi:hypothetical protein